MLKQSSILLFNNYCVLEKAVRFVCLNTFSRAAQKREKAKNLFFFLFSLVNRNGLLVFTSKFLHANRIEQQQKIKTKIVWKLLLDILIIFVIFID